MVTVVGGFQLGRWRAIPGRTGRVIIHAGSAWIPDHSGHSGRSAQAGQIQQASHSRHRQVRWDDPVQLVQGWLLCRMLFLPRACPAGHLSGMASMSS